MARIVAFALVFLGFGLFGIVSGVTPSVRAQTQGPQPVVDVSTFHQELAPYGEWLQREPYGWVWRPYGVPPWWRPYTYGSWVYTEEYGWVWESEWEWGWAPFHYGRWYYDDLYGWVWVPDTVWGPGWVCWRMGGDYYGWAPFPPDVDWNPEIGLGPDGCDLPSFWWVFVNESVFLERRIWEHIVPRARNVSLIPITRSVTDMRLVEGRIVNRSINVQQLEKAIGRPVPIVRVREVNSLAALNGERRPGEVAIFRPRVTGSVSVRTPRITTLSRKPTPSSQLLRDQENERTLLNNYHIGERAVLDQQQATDLRQPPVGFSAEDLAAQHEAENREFTNNVVRDRGLLDSYHVGQFQDPVGLTTSSYPKFNFSPEQFGGGGFRGGGMGMGRIR